MSKSKKAENLMEQGYDFVADCDYEKAIEVGKQLRKLKHSSAFEILGLAFAGSGNVEKAIEVLEEGVKHAPQVWLLWQLLGNYYSDVERYAQAHKCYETARKCPGADEASVNFNCAVVSLREDKYNKAIGYLDAITDDAFHFRAAALRANVLIERGEYEAAISVAQSVLTDEWDNEDDFEEAAQVYFELGKGLWKKGKHDLAMKAAQQALEYDLHCSDAFWLIRNIHGEVGRNAKCHNLLVEGVWPEKFAEGEEPSGFFTNVEVICESPEEGFEYVRRTLPDDWVRSLSLSEWTILAEKTDEFKGVYGVSEFASFPLEED